MSTFYFSNGLFSDENWYYDSEEGYLRYKGEKIYANQIKEFKVVECTWKWEKGTVTIKHTDGRMLMLQYKGNNQEDIYTVRSLIGLKAILQNSKETSKKENPNRSDSCEARNALASALTSDSSSSTSNGKNASVVGRAVVGQLIAGPAGAVVGALSAVDQNNKNK